jgi:putative ABC transport system ATP-binding protein
MAPVKGRGALKQSNQDERITIAGPQPQPGSFADKPDGREAFLCLEKLAKTYPEGDRQRIVLHGADLCFERGEIVAILGKSGSGKTTLLNLISGIDRVDSGTIWLAGQNLTRLRDREWTLFRRRNIGFIFQFFNLISTLTVWENLLLPLELNNQLNPQGLARAEGLLETVGLLDRRKTYPDRLSGGEQQRVALARALVHDPMLILADEPTGNLDEDTGRQVMDLLSGLVRQAGKNLMLVTHSAEAATYADRVFTLHEGALTERVGLADG